MLLQQWKSLPINMAIFEILAILLLSSVKFLFAPSAAVAAGYGFLKTIIITFSGGSCGILFFYYLGGWAVNKISCMISGSKNQNFNAVQNKRIFTKKNKWIVKIKSKFGLAGLSIITPGIISIPVGAILAAKYFKKNPNTIAYLVASVFLWSLLLTFVSVFIKTKVLLN